MSAPKGTERGACPDGGACHHECELGACFRVAHCEPLSGVFPGDAWPDGIASVPLSATRVEAALGTALDHIDVVRRYAALRRGEIGTGDPAFNGEAFAFEYGRTNPDALELVRSLGIAETQYSLLTGLPPGSLRWMASRIKRGVEAARRDAKAVLP